MNDRNSDRELGRLVWARAIRLGSDVSGKTPYELEALGRKLREELEAAGVSPRHIAGGVREAAMQVDTAGRGAADVFTFGNSAEISAGMDALLGRGGSGDFRSRYHANLQREEERDDYDREHRPIARFAGEAGATALMYRGASRGVAERLDKLPPVKKGPFGERLSEMKTVRSGDLPTQTQKTVRLSAGSTRVDHATRDGKLVEAKFGSKATQTHRQKQAERELGSQYRTDWWLPGHVGDFVGTSLAGVASMVSNRDRAR